MQRHLEQAAHNKEFKDCVDKSFPERFFDWKITVCFYTALHLIHALAKKRGIYIGESHEQVAKNIDPNRMPPGAMQINKQAWGHYRNLSKYARAARYDGITDFATFEKMMEQDYKECQIHMNELTKYLRNQGLPIE
jgi:hypothetical protein